MDSVIQVIQSLGFPIACVVAMFWMWQVEVKSHDSEMEKMHSALETQTKEMTDALNKNTVVLEKIMTILGRQVDDGK